MAENTPRPARRGDDALDKLAELAERWRTASAREIAAGLADLVVDLPGIAAVRVVVPDPTEPIEESRPPGASRELVRVDDIGPIELWIARRGRRSEDAIVRLALAQAALAIEAAGLRGRLEGIGRTRDEFVAAFGHELRDRLAPIFTSLTLLKMGEGRPEAHRQVIERQVAQLAHLVNDLIDVSHMARGELRIKHAPVDLASAVNGAIELATPLLGDRTSLAVRVDRGQLHVIGDRQRLAQMLAILLVRSARPGASGEIAVEGRRSAESVELRLRGAGALAREGVDAERTGFSSPPRSSDGRLATALGMSLVHGLVGLHGGTLTAEGGDLVLRLPAHVGIERPRTVVPPKLTAGRPAGLRVLVVDDNVDAADTLATALRASGLDAQAAYGPVEALELVEARAFEVAVLDIGLPLMDGYELARRLRRINHGDDLTLIALTGYGEATDAARSEAAGFRRHFVKPIQLGTLLAAIVQDATRGPRGQA